MGFKLEELMTSIIQGPLDDEEKVVLLTRLLKEGQTEDEVFLLKDDHQDTYDLWRRRYDADNGRYEIVKAYNSPEDAVSGYVLSLGKENSQTK